MQSTFIAVYSTSVYDPPYRLYVGEQSTPIDTMSLVRDYKYDDDITTEMLEDEHGFAVSSDWMKETQCWFASVVRNR